MGMRGMVENTIYLEDVPVRTEDVLGKLGAGMDVAQEAMMFARLTIAAASVCGMKCCDQLMLRYATRRTIATGTLLDNPVTLACLSDLTASITSVNALVTQIARALDAGRAVPPEIYAVAKITGTESFWRAADALVQLSA